jgi:hypothetical protein
MKALFRPRAKVEVDGCHADSAAPSRFEYFDFSFISVMLPPMTLFEAPRRLP